MSRRKRRKGLHIPDVPRDKVQPGKEQFYYILEMVKANEENHIRLIRRIGLNVEVITEDIRASMVTLNENFRLMKDEMNYIMQLLGYKKDVETGLFTRPEPIPEKDEAGRFAI